MDSVRVHCADKKRLNSCQGMVAITVSLQGFCRLLEEKVQGESSSGGSLYHLMIAVIGATLFISWFLFLFCYLHSYIQCLVQELYCFYWFVFCVIWLILLYYCLHDSGFLLDLLKFEFTHYFLFPLIYNIYCCL